ncbi:MAG: sulfite exporter TauE/SafE family protein [Erysipelotrichaceae bacterium]
MVLICLAVALFASMIGAISGIGGGVIIKPVLDQLGFFEASTISFLSGCTVLSMAILSYLISRKDKQTIAFSIAIPLAIGASIGGIVGKQMFQVFNNLASTNQIGIVQNIILLLINLFVFAYMLNRDKIKTMQMSNRLGIIAVGLSLGIISSFLGIGGGPMNIAVLYFLFSLDPKQTATYSLFIILCSQAASFGQTIITQTVPVFDWNILVLMCLGGMLGATFGRAISKKMNSEHVAKLFTVVLILLMGINILNIVTFMG